MIDAVVFRNRSSSYYQCVTDERVKDKPKEKI